jgi:phage FluMu protein Com
MIMKVTKGLAVFTGEGLRCASPRPNDIARYCGRLLVKKSASGQLAGEFKCDRCNAICEVQLTDSQV